MALKWIDKITGVGDDNDPNEGSVNQEENYVTEINEKTGKMQLLQPRAFSEAQQIADYLKGNNSVIVSFDRVTPDQAKRIVDFLNGTIYAIGGNIQKLGGGIFLCTPDSIEVEGSITSDGGNKVSKSKKDDDENFDW